jgi:MFS family permease
MVLHCEYTSIEKTLLLHTYTLSYLASTFSQLIFGQLGSLFSPKWTFVLGIAVFETGCLISGFANSSIVMIPGRAISGLGFAAIVASALT